jgi:tetratricopeptide (TPR) repeat protein
LAEQARASASLPPQKRWMLNVRLLAKTLVAVLLLSPAAYFWHAHQLQRNAAVFLDRAASLEAEGNSAEAAENLFRYLQLNPDDVEARIRLAKNFGRSAKTRAEKSRAVQLFALAIGLAPDQVDLRREHMVLLLETGDYSTALARADELLKEHPQDAKALRVHALGLYARWRLNSEGSLTAAAESLEQASRADPADVGLAVELARIYRTQLREPAEAERQQLADAVIDRLVTSSPRKTEAYLGRYAYRREFGIAGADEDLDRAAEADADKSEPSVQMAIGMRALQAQNWTAAAESFQNVIAADGSSTRGYLGLAEAHSGQGHDRLAVEALQTGLQRVGVDNIELNLQLAATHLDAKRLNEAQQTLSRLEPQIARMLGREQNELLSRLYTLQAQAKLAARDYWAAIARLKQIVTLAQAETDSARQVAVKGQVYSRLGDCYLALRQFDQAGIAFQQAAELQPRLARPRLEAARAWEAAGRLDEALRQFAVGLAIEGAPASGWTDYCYAILRQQAALPAANRNWQALERALLTARALLPDDLSLKVFEAEYEAQQGQVDLAMEMLRGLEQRAVAVPGMAGRMVLNFERFGQPADADRLIEKMRSQTPKKGALATLLAGMELLARRKQYDQAERLLNAGMNDLPDDERRVAQDRLIFLLLAQGESDRAQASLVKLAKGDSRNPRPLQLLLELASDSGDLTAIERWQQQLQDLEGPEGTSWRFYRGQILIRRAAEASAPNAAGLLKEAEQLQQEIERLRPAWAPGYVLKAGLYQTPTKRDDSAATEAYVQALRLGENRLAVYEGLIFLLYRQNRFAEAAVYLDRLRESANLSPYLASLGVAIDARQGNFPRAIEAARREVAREPDRAASHLQLGQLLAMDRREGAADQPAVQGEAEAELKRATELAPVDISMWSALLAFYSATNQTEAAQAMLDGLKQRSKISAEDRPVFFAQAYELLGDVEQAKAFHLEAIAAAPDRAGVQLNAARFFFRIEPQLAEQCVRRVLAVDPADDTARRLLATLLASRGGSEQEFEEIWSLLDSKAAGETADVGDRRLEAMLLLRRGGSEYRRRAQKMLESLVADGKRAEPIDRLLLARLYEAEGQAGAAREQLQALANRENPNPLYMATYADHLLRTGRGKEAGVVIDQLAATRPETRNSGTLSLRVRWLKDQEQESKIQPLLEAFLKNSLTSGTSDAEQARTLLQVAQLCASIDLPNVAENCFRRAVQRDPATYPNLAQWLAQRGQLNEAIETCLRADETDHTARPAIILSSILAAGSPSDADRSLAESVLASALQAHANETELLVAIGTLRLLEGKNEEAIRLLRRTLEVDARNLGAMNNLAMVLSRDPKTQNEAIAYLDRALKIAGSNSELLDSKGWILLQQHKPAEAEALFLEALSLPPGDPRHRFHLALAYQMQGKSADAQRTLDQAREEKLSLGLLSPEERVELNKLEQALP